ncbi:shikimate dehydrogenase family protein [Cnuibacter sp. UC19_7]|uniref:shikimate dehydrogenase family protein n=1 Tax=Cnuibacter sp. UC19_7 TaxID=3350166 RepID=UPI00366AA414
MTLRFAVLGSPIAHSRSPLLHRAAFDVLSADAEYGRAELVEGQLAAYIEGLDAVWRGLSLTMPLKEDGLALADDVDEVARLSAAANTLLLTSRDGRRRVSAFNTDVFGMVRALTEAGVGEVRHALVLGGGATARSAAVAAAQLGAEHLDVVVRDPSRAEGVAAVARDAGLTVDVHPLATAGDDLRPDLTVSTLPGGTGADQRIAGWAATSSGALLDVAYDPWPSPLAALWTRAGSIAVSGLDMLLHQAVAQQRIWWNGDPLIPLSDEDAVTAAMRSAVAAA